MSTAQSYQNAIRFFISDFPQTNMILGEEESSDARIALAMMMVLEEFYALDPRKANYTIEQFPSAALMINGSVIQLLRMAGILHSRNVISYQAGNLSVQLWNKAKDYMGWIQHMTQEYYTMRATLIKQINIYSAMSGAPMGLHSEYYLSGFNLPEIV